MIKAISRAIVRLLPKLAYPVLTGPLKGMRIQIGSMSGPGRGASVYVNQVEPDQTARFVQAVRPGALVFDIGANVGYYSLLASRLVGVSGRVVAVEPAIRNLSFLHLHRELNGLKNLSILASACSHEQALLGFEQGENFALGRVSDGASKVTTSDFAATVTIDSLTRQCAAQPAVIKIDVEGAEYDVLRGAKDTICATRPTIFLSVHSNQLRNDCLSLLHSFDYEVDPIGGSLDSADEYHFRARES